MTPNAPNPMIRLADVHFMIRKVGAASWCLSRCVMFARITHQAAEPRKIPIRNKNASCPFVIVNSKRANNARNSVIVIGFKNVRIKTDR